MKKYLVLLLLPLFSCCKTKEILQNTRIDTLKVVNLSVDTMLLHDSVYVREISRNDTIFLTKYVQRFKYKSRVVRDTIYKTKFKTIYKEKVVTKPTLFDFNVIIIIVLGLLIGVGVYQIYKLIKIF